MFDFHQQNDQSQEPVKRVVKWLQSRDSIEWARDVQNEAQYHYQGDIYLKRVGRNPEFMEVKVESRSSTDTPNLAIERYSDAARQSNGGPWNTTATYYAHLYGNGVLVIMMRVRLLAWLSAQLSAFKTFEAANATYTTVGILVKREDAKRELGQSYQEYRLAA